MNKQLSEILLDYQLETKPYPKPRHVAHAIEDPDQPPSASCRIEIWRTAKSPIGTGGQGRVYLQECVKGARNYRHRALKMIPCGEDDGQRRYTRELETMIRFSHEKVPGLIKCHHQGGE